MSKTVKVTFDKYASQKVQVDCANCKHKTNHEILRSAEESGSEPIAADLDLHWFATHQIIRCQGCDEITFRRISSNSEEYTVDFEVIETESLYPDRSHGRSAITDVHLLPSDLGRIYGETLSALARSQPVLAGIGVRAIVETVTKDKKAKGRDLLSKIDDLVTKGVLTADGAEILHKLRVLGNKAAHEVMAHSASELELALDVVEHLFQAVYILPTRAKTTFK